MNNREDVVFDSDVIESILSNNNEDNTVVYRMQKAYAEWMSANTGLIEEEVSEVSELWEEGVTAFYDELMLFREEMGENVSAYWSRKERSSSGISMNEKDKLEFTPVSGLEDPVEKWGNLEVCARLFQEGISCGTSFQDSFRNMDFESGLNPNEIHDNELNVNGTEQAIADLKNHERKIVYALSKDLEKATELNQIKFDFAKNNADRIIDICKMHIKLIVMQCSTIEEAEKAVMYPTSNKVGELLSSVSREFSDGKNNMPYSFKEWRTMQFVKGTSYESAITQFAATKSTTKTVDTFINVDDNGNLTYTIKNDVVEKRVVKTINGKILIELSKYVRDLIGNQFGNLFSKSRETFFKVSNGINAMLAISERAEVVEILKKANARQISEISVALKHASSRLTVERFEKDLYSILIDAGYVKSDKKFVINNEINSLIDAANKGDFSKVTPDIAKKMKSVARSNMVHGLIHLTHDAYMVIHNITLEQPVAA